MITRNNKTRPAPHQLFTACIVPVLLGAALALFAACEQPAGTPQPQDFTPDNPPAAPGEPVVRPLNNALDIVWNQPEGARGYTLRYGVGADPETAAEFPEEKIDAPWRMPAQAQITGLANGTTYRIWVKARNAKGESSWSEPGTGTPLLDETVPFLYFDSGSAFLSNNPGPGSVRLVTGRRFVLAPVRWRVPPNAAWEWTVDGIKQSDATQYFARTWNAAGTFSVAVKASWPESGETKTAQAMVAVKVEDAPAAGTGTTPHAALYEFMPAPGQFVGLYPKIEFPFANTAALTAAAKNKTNAASMIWQFSLGSYGGYIITKFDHRVTPRGTGQYDFTAKGNAFGDWHEPGIVWVAQADSEGKPGAWYELAGSAAGGSSGGNRTENSAWRQRYAIMWHAPGEDNYCTWRDSDGKQGTFTVGTGMAQTRYPVVGTSEWLLIAGSRLDRSKMPDVNSITGYVDVPQIEHFRIKDAIQADGSPANLAYIDFVKIQCGPFETSGTLGEVSTETGFPVDLAMPGALPSVQGVWSGGQYNYIFVNPNTGYNLFISFDGGPFEELAGFSTSTTKSYTSVKSSVTFDYYGGNLGYTITNGTVTFGAVPSPYD